MIKTTARIDRKYVNDTMRTKQLHMAVPGSVKEGIDIICAGRDITIQDFILELVLERMQQHAVSDQKIQGCLIELGAARERLAKLQSTIDEATSKAMAGIDFKAGDI